MSDLDDRLLDALHRYKFNDKHECEKAIAHIKQVFADEGYHLIEIKDPSKPMLMTGQEWYDRFEKELASVITPDDMRAAAIMKTLSAAKRATELEEKE